MSFTSILKKIGQIVNAADALIPIYGPMIHAVTSTIPGTDTDKIYPVLSGIQDKLDLMSHAVVDAEVMGQAIGVAGPDKAKLAAPKIAQLVLDMQLIRGKKPKDADKFKEDSARLAGVIADLLNNIEG